MKQFLNEFSLTPKEHAILFQALHSFGGQISVPMMSLLNSGDPREALFEVLASLANPKGYAPPPPGFVFEYEYDPQTHSLNISGHVSSPQPYMDDIPSVSNPFAPVSAKDQMGVFWLLVGGPYHGEVFSVQASQTSLVVAVASDLKPKPFSEPFEPVFKKILYYRHLILVCGKKYAMGAMSPSDLESIPVSEFKRYIQEVDLPPIN